MPTSALLFIHLVSFAAYVGAGFAQLQLMKRSEAPGIEPAVRADREALSAAIVTKIQLPAIIGSIVSGGAFIVQNPALMKLGWLHGKLLCVVLLLGLNHAEMFNARRIVQARSEGGDAASEEIAARKRRQAVFGSIAMGLVLAILILVTFVRLGV